MGYSVDFLEGSDVLEGQEQGVFPREIHIYGSDPISDLVREHKEILVDF